MEAAAGADFAAGVVVFVRLLCGLLVRIVDRRERGVRLIRGTEQGDMIAEGAVLRKGADEEKEQAEGPDAEMNGTGWTLPGHSVKDNVRGAPVMEHPAP
jgi:hypothetical protein